MTGAQTTPAAPALPASPLHEPAFTALLPHSASLRADLAQIQTDGLAVEWGRAGGGYEADIQVLAVDRRWLLKDITNLIAQADAYVLAINSDNVRDSGRAVLRLRLKVADYGQLSNLLGKIDALPGVDEVRRVG